MLSVSKVTRRFLGIRERNYYVMLVDVRERLVQFPEAEQTTLGLHWSYTGRHSLLCRG